MECGDQDERGVTKPGRAAVLTASHARENLIYTKSLACATDFLAQAILCLHYNVFGRFRLWRGSWPSLALSELHTVLRFGFLTDPPDVLTPSKVPTLPRF